MIYKHVLLPHGYTLNIQVTAGRKDDLQNTEPRLAFCVFLRKFWWHTGIIMLFSWVSHCSLGLGFLFVCKETTFIVGEKL